MKYQSDKTYPWPVLRPTDISDDYPNGEFYLDIKSSKFEVSEKSKTGLRINSRLILSDKSLLDLVSRGKAEYALLIDCKSTFYRDCLISSDGIFFETIESGNLRGKVTLSPFLVAKTGIPSFSSSGWHHDYRKWRINWSQGDVLAEGVPVSLDVGWSIHDDISTIFTTSPDSQLARDEWNCDFADEKINIMMHPSKESKFKEAHSECDDDEIVEMLSSMYIPVLIHVFHTVHASDEEYSHLRWYKAIDRKLLENERPSLGDKSMNIVSDVQMLLNYPSMKISVLR